MRGGVPNETTGDAFVSTDFIHGHDSLDTEFDIHDNRLFILS